VLRLDKNNTLPITGNLIMLLAEAIENHLGHIDSWPSYILRYLFSDHPSPVRSTRLKKVIAFFCGKDVPCTLARRFYICNGKASKYVTDQFNEWYYVWQKSRYKPHTTEYYNMRLEKFIFINGSCQNKMEPVLPEVLVMT
jgi:hypothetical protein